MREVSIIDDFLQVLVPGRRRLKNLQQSRAHESSQQQARLIHEYQSLAELTTSAGSTHKLGEFDSSAFQHFITRPECDQDWTKVESEVARFHLPEMAGGVNPGDQRLIFHLGQFLRPSNILEIGTHIGASTVHILLSLLDAKEVDRQLTSVDIKDVNCPEETPWKQFGAEHSPSEMVKQLGGSEIVQFVSKSSVSFLEDCSKTYDLIFLDGDHSASAVYQELPLALDRLANGGVILLHDYFPQLQSLWPNGKSDNALMHADVIPGVYLAVQRFQNEGNQIAVTPFGDLPWPTKLGSNVTSLALVSRANS